MSGDLITHLDKEQILGLTLQEAVEKMRGPVNSPITLTIVRKGVEDPFDVKVTRDVIHINPVKYNAEGDDVGYIRVTTFNEQTTANLQKAIEDLKKQLGPKLKGYVIDLRNNPGGLLDQAISVSDAFLDQGAIVLTRGRNLEETQRSNARPGDITDGQKIVVLINGGSASASEIVAGALQDHHRATIIGTRSFGKGSVQTIIPLGSNGALRLTTARYYTPSGRSIQAKGIEPEVVVEEELPDDLKQKAELQSTRGEANLRGHLKGEDEDEAGGGRRRGVRQLVLCGAREGQGHAAEIRARSVARHQVGRHGGQEEGRGQLNAASAGEGRRMPAMTTIIAGGEEACTTTGPASGEVKSNEGAGRRNWHRVLDARARHRVACLLSGQRCGRARRYSANRAGDGAWRRRAPRAPAPPEAAAETPAPAEPPAAEAKGDNMDLPPGFAVPLCRRRKRPIVEAASGSSQMAPQVQSEAPTGAAAAPDDAAPPDDNPDQQGAATAQPPGMQQAALEAAGAAPAVSAAARDSGQRDRLDHACRRCPLPNWSRNRNTARCPRWQPTGGVRSTSMRGRRAMSWPTAGDPPRVAILVTGLGLPDAPAGDVLEGPAGAG